MHLLKIPDISTETINGLRHYICGDNKYPSITSVLGSKPKDYLIEWKKSLGEEKANAETERCAIRGTNVHELCEHFLNGDEIDYSKYDELHVKQFNKLKFVLKKISNIYTQEAALYSNTLKVAGRVDCIAFFNNVLSIIDFKTSNNNKNEQQIYDYFLQETFYALALLEMTGIEVKQIVTIISVEKEMCPQIFIKDFKPYIKPLISRIDEFYSNFNSPLIS